MRDGHSFCLCWLYSKRNINRVGMKNYNKNCSRTRFARDGWTLLYTKWKDARSIRTFESMRLRYELQYVVTEYTYLVGTNVSVSCSCICEYIFVRQFFHPHSYAVRPNSQYIYVWVYWTVDGRRMDILQRWSGGEQCFNVVLQCATQYDVTVIMLCNTHKRVKDIKRITVHSTCLETRVKLG